MLTLAHALQLQLGMSNGDTISVNRQDKSPEQSIFNPQPVRDNKRKHYEHHELKTECAVSLFMCTLALLLYVFVMLTYSKWLYVCVTGR